MTETDFDENVSVFHSLNPCTIKMSKLIIWINLNPKVINQNSVTVYNDSNF